MVSRIAASKPARSGTACGPPRPVAMPSLRRKRQARWRRDGSTAPPPIPGEQAGNWPTLQCLLDTSTRSARYSPHPVTRKQRQSAPSSSRMSMTWRSSLPRHEIVVRGMKRGSPGHQFWSHSFARGRGRRAHHHHYARGRRPLAGRSGATFSTSACRHGLVARCRKAMSGSALPSSNLQPSSA